MDTAKQTAKIATSLLAALILSSPSLAAETKEKPKSIPSKFVEKVGEMGSGAAGGFYYISGASLVRSGKYKQALVELNKAIEFCPKNGAFFKVRAQCYFLMDEYSKCIDDAATAIKLGNDDSETFYVRGRAYYDLKEYSKCAADTSETIRKDPNNASAYLLLAICAVEFSDREKAVSNMERAFQLDPALEGSHSKSLKDAIAALKVCDETIKSAQDAVAEANKEKANTAPKTVKKTKPLLPPSSRAAKTTAIHGSTAAVVPTQTSFKLPDVLVYPQMSEVTEQEKVKREHAKPAPAHSIETFSGGALSIREFDKDGHPISQE